MVLALRTRLSATVLITAVLAMASGTALNARAEHQVCAAKHHDCGRAATIARCCCGPQNDAARSLAPIEARTQVSPDLIATPAVAPDACVVGRGLHVSRAQASPPPLVRLDLPTLFASLLI